MATLIDNNWEHALLNELKARIVMRRLTKLVDATVGVSTAEELHVASNCRNDSGVQQGRCSSPNCTKLSSQTAWTTTGLQCCWH